MHQYDNFFLPTADMEAGRRFYQEVLGLPVKFDFPDRKMLAFQVGAEEPALILNGNPGAKPVIWFVVEDVDREYQRLQARGVKFLSQPFPIKTGRAVEFEDPNGNRLGITDYRQVQ